MAFDPVQEDCLRLILAAMERYGADPASDAAFIARASEADRLDPATLIHTDRDRSFHLGAMATELADYRAPFAPSEAEAEQLFSHAEDYLREAVELDPRNWDAQRMLATMRSISDDALIDYLIENLPAVEDEQPSSIPIGTDRSTSSPWRPSSQITAHPSPPTRQRPSSCSPKLRITCARPSSSTLGIGTRSACSQPWAPSPTMRSSTISSKTSPPLRMT